MLRSYHAAHKKLKHKGDPTAYQHFEMGMNLLIEVDLHAAGKEEIPRAFTRSGMLNASLRCFQSLRNGPGNAAPSLGFDFELLQSRLGQSVVFGAAVILGLSQKEEIQPSSFILKKKGTCNNSQAPFPMLVFIDCLQVPASRP
jgi:hypothetical protein